MRAHEPYLLLTANPDGTFTAETGFSDGATPEGLTLLVRDRNTTETLSEHALPANGRLTLRIPSVPYRVTFDGGPGHKVSKPGPELEAPVAKPESPKAATSADSSQPPAAPRPASASPVPAQSIAVPPAASSRGDTVRIALVVGIFFLFGTIAFALGYGAGRRSR